MRLLLSVVTVLLACGAAWAGPPANGTYNSVTQGGSMLDGHFSESWVTPGRDGQIGNTISAESWDGIALATEWWVHCPSIQSPPTLVSDTRDGNGTGDVVYQTDYDGGTFFLSKDGPWGDATEDYFGILTQFRVTTTYEYVFGTLIGIRSNVTLWGDFDGYDNCMSYVINNASFFGNTDDVGPLPPDFPAFRDENCDLGVWTRGGWGSVTQVTMAILGDCSVGAESSTWGEIKSRYLE